MTENVFYEHPASPKNGEQWMKERIRFDEIKISNINEGNNYTYTLKSRYKYEPLFHIMKVVTFLNGKTKDYRVKMASFPSTQFIAVRQYQNEELNQLRTRVRHHEPKSALPQGVPPPGVPPPGVPHQEVPRPGVPRPGVPPPGVTHQEVPLHGVPRLGVLLPGVPQPGVPHLGLPHLGLPLPGVPRLGVLLPGVPQPGVPHPGLMDMSVIPPIFGFGVQRLGFLSGGLWSF